MDLSIITGPNGYGKTTIFKLIYSLFCKDFDAFIDVPFKQITCQVDDYIIRIRQEREMTPVEESSDLPGDERVRAIFEVLSQDGRAASVLQEFVSGEEVNGINGQLNLLLNSTKCYFLTDNRVLRRKLEYGKRDEDPSSNDTMISLAKEFAGIVLKGDNERAVSLFKELVSFFKFADKDIIVDGIFGIRFRINNSSKTIIPITALSSGEKHLLLQLFELIFKGQSGDVVMIDEPELSLHPAWLNEYIAVLRRIQSFKLDEKRRLQIVLATHSPMIIGERWNETLDLYTLRNNG